MDENSHPKGKTTGIEVVGGQATIANGTIEGTDVGIRSRGAEKISAKNIVFDGVEKPFELENVKDGRIEGTRIVNDPKMRRDPAKTFLGWQRNAKGPPLPSYCPKCQTVFASQNYDLSGLYFTLWGNPDVCINCGSEEAHLSEGHFNLINDTIKILRAPDVTYEMVGRLEEIVQNALYGKLRKRDAEESAEKVHKGFGALLRRYITVGSLGLFLSMISVSLDGWNALDNMDPENETLVHQRRVETSLQNIEGLLGKINLQNEKDQPGRGIVENQPEAKPKTKATRDKSGSKVTDPRSITGEINESQRKKKKNKLKNHRQSFGGSRSR